MEKALEAPEMAFRCHAHRNDPKAVLQDGLVHHVNATPVRTGTIVHPMRRPRSDSKLRALTAEQREQLHAWFEDNLTFAVIAERVKADFGVKTSSASLSKYHEYWGWEKLAGQMAAIPHLAVVRTPRSDCKLHNLSLEHRATLSAWYAESVPSEEIARRVTSQMGVSTSASAVSCYFKRWQRKRLLTTALLDAVGRTTPGWHTRQGGKN